MPDCGIVQAVDVPGVAAAVVRSTQNTAGGDSLLAPICAESCGTDEDACGDVGALSVPFDTRSYLLREYLPGKCSSTRLGGLNYECVDYAQGAVYLSGKTLSFEVDLGGVGCGCNAALYLVSMPQSHDAGKCANDYYCDANNVCGVECTE